MPEFRGQASSDPGFGVSRQRRVRGRLIGRFRRPCFWSCFGRVESSSGLTGVWLPESSCPGGDWHPLRGAAAPVQSKLKTLSQRKPVQPGRSVVAFSPPTAARLPNEQVSPSLLPVGSSVRHIPLRPQHAPRSRTHSSDVARRRPPRSSVWRLALVRPLKWYTR